MKTHFASRISQCWGWVLVIAAILLAGDLNQAFAGEGSAPSTDAGTLDYFLVVTGGEVLTGVYADAHTSFIAQNLLPLGCRCVGSLMVDDEPGDLTRAIQFASSHADLVIVTGGLGPTANDITREIIAAFLGIDLQEDPELLAILERRFNQAGGQLRPNLRRQALVPAGGGYFINAHGTAAGLIYSGRTPIVALPGPPRELQPMVRDALVPYLQERFGIRPPGFTSTFRFVGAGQSLISQTLDDHGLLPPGARVGSVFDGGRVDFTVSLPGRSPANREKLDELGAAIRQHLGQYLYGTDDASLEDVVVRGLLERKATLTIAEIGSGGMIATSLHAGRRAEQLLIATLAAPTAEKMQILLPASESGSTTESMMDQVKGLARKAREQTGATWSLAAIPDVHPEHGNPILLVACGMPDERWVTVQLPPPAPSVESRFRFSTQLLDWLHRELVRHP
jgi:nicotinamide-nucleotide amidase